MSDNSNPNDPNAEQHQKDMMKSNVFVVVISVFFMAFVVAASVEETMKFFVVRCCPFPSTLKDPNTVLVYLMSAGITILCTTL